MSQRTTKTSRQEISYPRIRIEPVGAFRQAVSLVVIHQELALSSVRPDGGDHLLSFAEGHARVMAAMDHEQRYCEAIDDRQR